MTIYHGVVLVVSSGSVLESVVVRHVVLAAMPLCYLPFCLLSHGKGCGPGKESEYSVNPTEFL
jgi:hypothetical protein